MNLAWENRAKPRNAVEPQVESLILIDWKLAGGFLSCQLFFTRNPENGGVPLDLKPKEKHGMQKRGGTWCL